jgi:hypothetical protein
MQKSRLLFDEVVWFQGYERVAASELDDTTEILGTDELAAEKTLSHPPDFVAIEVANQLVDELGPRGGTRTNTVTRQLLEHVGAVTEPFW